MSLVMLSRNRNRLVHMLFCGEAITVRHKLLGRPSNDVLWTADYAPARLQDCDADVALIWRDEGDDDSPLQRMTLGALRAEARQAVPNLISWFLRCYRNSQVLRSYALL